MHDQLSDVLDRVQRFLRTSRFADAGGVMTDLDGTAIHESHGRIVLSRTIETGLQRVHAAGREVMVNTMRFPLSIMRTLGSDWLRATGNPMHAVTLKGSLVGRIAASAQGTIGFEEIAARPLDATELDEIVVGVRALASQGVDDLLVFHYPRDWTAGEQVWTPDAARIPHVRDKYRSASRVFAGGVDTLEATLHARPHCMVFLLIDAPRDRRMPYQHAERERFFTHDGVDKRHGAHVLADALGLALPECIGAGDAEPDTFLDDVAFAVIVGNENVAFRGKRDTVRVPDASALGEVLLAAAAFLNRVRPNA